MLESWRRSEGPATPPSLLDQAPSSNSAQLTACIDGLLEELLAQLIAALMPGEGRL